MCQAGQSEAAANNSFGLFVSFPSSRMGKSDTSLLKAFKAETSKISKVESWSLGEGNDASILESEAQQRPQNLANRPVVRNFIINSLEQKIYQKMFIDFLLKSSCVFCANSSIDCFSPVYLISSVSCVSWGLDHRPAALDLIKGHRRGQFGRIWKDELNSADSARQIYQILNSSCFQKLGHDTILLG